MRHQVKPNLLATLADDNDHATLEVTLADGRNVTVTVTASAGSDNAAVVFVDTSFAPDNSDGDGGLRVMVNDGDAFTGVPYEEASPWVCPACGVSDSREENGAMRCVCGVDTPLEDTREAS